MSTLAADPGIEDIGSMALTIWRLQNTISQLGQQVTALQQEIADLKEQVDAELQSTS